MNSDTRQIKSCRICDSENIVKFLSLGEQPWCDNFVSDLEENEKIPKYPLELYFCNDCTLVQLGYTVPKETMFVDFIYLSGVMDSVKKHFEKIASNVVKKFNLSSSDLVLDIGSNDGTLLKCYKKFGLKVLGIDPAKPPAEIANAAGIETINTFFNEEIADMILKKYGKATVISAAGVFYHLEELHSVVLGIKKLLSPTGIFVIQFSYLVNMIEKTAFDHVYHEHLMFYTLRTLSYLLSKYDLEIFDVNEVSIHGGTIVAYVSHHNSHPKSDNVEKLMNLELEGGYYSLEKYTEFATKVKKIKTKLNEILTQLKNEGKTVYGYGAPAKGNTMLNYCGIDSTLVQYLIERNQLKCNKFAPGSGIKVIDEDKIETKPDYYLILPWNFLDDFVEKEKKFFENGGKFIVPISEPHILDNNY